MNDNAIVIAGGSGFIGNALAKAFVATDRPVFVLTRKPRPHEPTASRRFGGMASRRASGCKAWMAPPR